MAARASAGLLLHRPGSDGLEVLIGHMGGPFWMRRREGAWSVPKGEIEAGEIPLAAAEREFAEEVGRPAPATPRRPLGTLRYSSGKTVELWAVEAPDFAIEGPGFSTVTLEWPPRSGRTITFPELDELRWMPVDAARPLLVAGQRPALDRLQAALAHSAEDDGSATSPS